MLCEIILLPLLAAVFGTGCSSMDSPLKSADLNGNQKVLIVYYTRTGNTKQMAGIIHRLAGGDCVELKTVDPYPSSYDALLEQAQREINSGHKPPLDTIIEDINTYDVIFVGYPIWLGTTPPPVVTFLSEHNFPGKKIIPFCTSGGSPGDISFRNVEKLCSQATVLEGLRISGASVGSAQAAVTGWLRRIGIIK